MTDSPETTQINVEVPKRTKELAKEELEHGGLTRVVRETLTQIAHGEAATEKERVQDHLQELRDERRDLKGKRDNIDSEIENIDLKIERAERRLDQLRDREGEYEGALKMIEQSMHEDGINVWPGHGKVKEAAEVGDCTKDDVIADLKRRNPELPDERFQQNLH